MKVLCAAWSGGDSASCPGKYVVAPLQQLSFDSHLVLNICLISLKHGHQVFAWRLAQPGSSQSGVQNVGGLPFLVGTAGQPRDCPNSGWVDQAWGSKLVGQGGGCFDTTPSVSSSVQQKLRLASTLFLICPSQLNQASAENDYHNNCRAQQEAQTVTHCPRWGGSKSWYHARAHLA